MRMDFKVTYIQFWNYVFYMFFSHLALGIPKIEFSQQKFTLVNFFKH